MPSPPGAIASSLGAGKTLEEVLPPKSSVMKAGPSWKPRTSTATSHAFLHSTWWRCPLFLLAVPDRSGHSRQQAPDPSGHSKVSEISQALSAGNKTSIPQNRSAPVFLTPDPIAWTLQQVFPGDNRCPGSPPVRLLKPPVGRSCCILCLWVMAPRDSPRGLHSYLSRSTPF